MRPRIEAERVLDLTSALLYALGRLKKADEWVEGLRRREQGLPPERPQPATEEALAAMGISVHKLPVEKPEED